MVGEMSALAILTKCLLANCPLANCPLAKCPLAKCPLAKCPLAKCHGFMTSYPSLKDESGQMHSDCPGVVSI